LARKAGAGIVAVDAVQAPGHVGGRHLTVIFLKLHALPQVKAIALPIIHHLIGIRQGLRGIVQAILANGHEDLIATKKIHAVEGARGLEAIWAADLTEVGDV
jgi:hypothetical protein